MTIGTAGWTRTTDLLIHRRKTWAARIDGSNAGLTLDQARKEARKLAGDVERGKDPVEEEREERRKTEEARRKAEAAATTTLKAICEEYLTREGGMTRDAADGKATFSGKLRSAKERLQTFERLVYPEKIAGHQIDEVKRSEIVKLLDKIEDNNGPRMAHVTLAYLSRVFNWHASRDDTFRSPVRAAGLITYSNHRRPCIMALCLNPRENSLPFASPISGIV